MTIHIPLSQVGSALDASTTAHSAARSNLIMNTSNRNPALEARGIVRIGQAASLERRR